MANVPQPRPANAMLRYQDFCAKLANEIYDLSELLSQLESDGYHQIQLPERVIQQLYDVAALFSANGDDDHVWINRSSLSSLGLESCVDRFAYPYDTREYGYDLSAILRSCPTVYRACTACLLFDLHNDEINALLRERYESLFLLSVLVNKVYAPLSSQPDTQADTSTDDYWQTAESVHLRTCYLVQQILLGDDCDIAVSHKCKTLLSLSLCLPSQQGAQAHVQPLYDQLLMRCHSLSVSLQDPSQYALWRRYLAEVNWAALCLMTMPVLAARMLRVYTKESMGAVLGLFGLGCYWMRRSAVTPEVSKRPISSHAIAAQMIPKYQIPLEEWQADFWARERWNFVKYCVNDFAREWGIELQL